MKRATVTGAALAGVYAAPIRVEATISDRGLAGIHIVGMGKTAVRECQCRIRSAMKNCGYRLPKGRITINLEPTDMPKSGGGLDLAIALALLTADGVVPINVLEGYLVVGELGFDGSLRPVRGATAYAICAAERPVDKSKLLAPTAMTTQAMAVADLEVFGAEDLPSVVAFLCEERFLLAPSPLRPLRRRQGEGLDLSDVPGQDGAKRALEIAAAGGHNLLLVGPPGCGKSMLASRLPTILPPLSLEESLETTAIWSVAGLLDADVALLEERPLRAPHSTASDVGFIGSGVPPRPGEASLAHNGVLFLDDLPEFRRPVLESLHHVLEQGHVVVSRARRWVTFPAKVQLVATMNPCPCGMRGTGDLCCCTDAQVRHFKRRCAQVNAHIDICVDVTPSGGLSTSGGETSLDVRTRVVKAKERQASRYQGTSIRCNAALTPAALHLHSSATPAASELLGTEGSRLGFSALAYGRVLRVARTIADLDGHSQVGTAAVTEALAFMPHE